MAATGAVARRRSVAPFVGVAVLAGGLDLAWIGRHSLFLDETVSTSLASEPWHRFVQVVQTREANMVLYHVLLRGWVALGDSEVALRSLSVLAAVGTVVVVMALADRLFGRRAALLSGLALAVDPLMVQYAQQARGYALSMLLVSLSSLLFVRGVLDAGGRWTWAGYVATAALAAYSNFWAVLVPVAHASTLPLLPPGRVRWRPVALSSLTLVALLVPLGLLIRATDSAGTNWAAGTAAGRVFSQVRADVPHLAIDAAALVVVVSVAASVVLVRRSRWAARVAQAWPLVFIGAWLVVPVAAVVVVSFAYRPLLVVRYLGVCLPAAILLVGVALAALRGRWLAAMAAAAVVVASAVGVAAWYRTGPGQDWRAAVQAVAAEAQPGDGVVIVAPYMRIPFQWYLAGVPRAQRRLVAIYPPGAWSADPLRYDAPVPLSAAAVSQTAAAHRRVWLVLASADLYPAELAQVRGALRAARLNPARPTTWPGVTVELYRRSPGTP